jgi:hypothetical protein
LLEKNKGFVIKSVRINYRLNYVDRILIFTYIKFKIYNKVMGEFFFDQYSLLHFAVGIIAYFLNINIINLLIIHLIFEFIENTKTGINIINKYLLFWPGGKNFSDTSMNSLGDIISSILGWLCAYYINKTGLKNNWNPHVIKN